MAAQPQPTPDRRVVLLCEDDALILFGASEALREAGLEVIETGAARLALTELSARHIDILVTDIGLPDMSGLELARKARMSRPALPVVFATGQSVLADMETCPGAHVLLKPYNEADLLGMVRRALANA